MNISNMTITISDARTFFWQWDTGCKLRVTGAMENSQVHFYRDGMEEPLPMTCYTEGEHIVCDVPDEILQIPKKFAAYTYIIDENGGKTHLSKTFTVESRPKPANYVYTPTEKHTVEEIVAEAIEKALGGDIDFESEAILDVEELPTEGMNTSLLYRTAEGVYWYDGEWHKVADENDIPKQEDIESAVNHEKARAIEVENALTEKIDEVESIAKGASQAVSYGNYSTMVTAFNTLPNGIYKVGQGILIGTVNVPDLWIFAESAVKREYIYASDENFTNELKENGTIQVGYYVLSALETQKVDLRDYVQAYIGESKIIESNDSGESIKFSHETYGSSGTAYLSYEDTLTKEQFIGATVNANYSYYAYPFSTKITEAMVAEDTEDGLWIKVNDTEPGLLYIFVAYTDKYQPSCVTNPFPKVGVYLSSWGLYDAPYIESVEVLIKPTKLIDNRLIDLKNHPDFIIPEPDLSAYVKNTDEPGNVMNGAKAAGIRLNYASSCGLQMKTQAGKGNFLSVCDASGDIVEKRNGIYPLVANKLDTYMKIGIAGIRQNQVNGVWEKSLGHQIALTNEEKASAHNWLGIKKTYKKTFGVRIALSGGDEFIGTYVEYSTNDSLDVIAGTDFNPLYLAEVLNTQPSRLAIKGASTIYAVDGLLLNSAGGDQIDLVICYRDADGKSASHSISFATFTEENLIRTVEEI